MDYNKTIRLPKTDFPMRAGLPAREPGMLENWNKLDLYHEMLKKNEGSICGAQIFGNDPAIMAEASVMAAEISGCDFIDINMGCPMPKIANNGDGCGLMKKPELAGEIVKAVSYDNAKAYFGFAEKNA